MSRVLIDDIAAVEVAFESGWQPETDRSGGAMDRLRGKLTYANIVATLALVIAVGGGSYAVAGKKITSAQIKDGHITARDLARTRIVFSQTSAGSKAVASCGGHERLLGGGYFAATANATGSYPVKFEVVPNPASWVADRPQPSQAGITAYGLCLSEELGR